MSLENIQALSVGSARVCGAVCSPKEDDPRADRRERFVAGFGERTVEGADGPNDPIHGFSVQARETTASRVDIADRRPKPR